MSKSGLQLDILVSDVPCSGEGLFRRDANAKEEWSLEHVDHCALRQRRIIDDIIDTAGTLVEAAKTLREHGAKKIYAFATHGIFSGPASERIESCVFGR